MPASVPSSRPRPSTAVGSVRRLRWLASALAASLLIACGGGIDLAGGVGSGGSGLAEGTITGFGSVIVDGTRYDDSAAQVLVEDEGGQKQGTAMQLGQRVRLALDAEGKATQIEVLPQLLGPVTAAAQDGWLRVAGQWVRVSDDTVLVDHDGASNVPLGEEVEVHGTWQADDTRGVVLMAAMLRSRSAAAAAPVLVGGVVHAVDGATITLGAAQGSRLTLPPGAQVPAIGEAVGLWVSRAAWLQSTTGPWPVLRQRHASTVEEGATLVLGGVVRSVDGKRLSVQGLQVDWPGGPGVQTLPPAPGDVVRLTLRRVGAAWEVQRAEVRDEPAKLGGRVELKGRLTGMDWTAQPLLLTLRGVRLRIPPDVLSVSGCPALGAAPVDVEIEAARGRLPLQALALRCTTPPPDN
ncbi:MAG: hypothetical protein RLZ83_791 [Pseudomonadota bacterium]|jgi:hypothetical protein